MDFSTEWIGGIAGVLTTASFLPQVYKTWKLKTADSLSLPMLVLMAIGVLLWGIYGILIESISMIIANSITFLSTLLLLYFKVLYKKNG